MISKSEWAAKYGENVQITSNPPGSRSGLTPVSLAGVGRNALKRDPRDEEAETFQKEQLYGFTTQELIDLDAITQRRLKPPPAKVHAYIAPFWRKGNWSDGALFPDGKGRIETYPLPLGFHGKWIANNDVGHEFRTMIPPLREEVPIDLRRYPPWKDEDQRPDFRHKNELISLRTITTPQSEGYLRHQRRNLFKILKDYLTLSFKIDNADPLSAFGSAMTNNGTVEAFTETDIDSRSKRLNYIYTFLDSNILIPLLYNQLNDAETFGLRLWVATTLPYYMDDQLMELGAAMEEQAFGGYMKPMWNNRTFPNFGFWVEPGFPKTYDIGRRHPCSAILETPELPTQVLTIPVPVSLFEDINSEDFWTIIMRSYKVPIFKSMLVNEVSEAAQIRKTGETDGIEDPTPFLRTTQNVPFKSKRRKINERSVYERGLRDLIMTTAACTPAERKQRKFALAIHRSLLAIDRYWDSSRQISALVQRFAEIGRQISNIPTNSTATMPQDKSKWLQLLQDQVDIIGLTIREHESRIQALEAMVAGGRSMDFERRAVLREWNYNTRVFLRSITPHFNDDSVVTGKLHLMDLQLEVTRVRVWHHTEVSAAHSKDNRELLNIRKLWNTRLQLRNQGKRLLPVIKMCDTLMKSKDPGYSVYYIIALTVFRAHVIAFSNERRLFGSATLGLQAVAASLDTLRNDPEQSSHWKPVLVGWYKAACEASQKITPGRKQRAIVATITKDPIALMGRYP
ncbi:hypothetical protein BKA61DRAFT_731131 [Leptodontidium sp. MPI-SDFR-AT-0119]|nr:hypothetical protein BKA61DRAFT_731131 [Leptodontidium sp. MPI-SDFR-AT-0119]